MKQICNPGATQVDFTFDGNEIDATSWKRKNSCQVNRKFRYDNEKDKGMRQRWNNELPLKDIFEKFKTTCLLTKNLKNKSFP